MKEMYLGIEGNGFRAQAKITGVHTFEVDPYQYKGFHPRHMYTYETRYVYNMVDDRGNVLVWKTSVVMNKDGEPLVPGDIVELRGMIKRYGEYRGQEQIEVTRCKYTFVMHTEFHVKSREEVLQEKAEAQRASLKEGYEIRRVLYREYKNQYSECETVAGSYRPEYKDIEIIVRAA